MAGAISNGNLYTGYHLSSSPKSKLQRCTITTLTDADALSTGIILPAGSAIQTFTMKVISGCDKVSTLSAGFTGTAAGFLAASSVAAAAVGTVYKGVGTSLGTALVAATTVLLTGAVTSGPATTNVVVDIEVVYFATDMA